MKLLEIWDECCGWKQFCDGCGAKPDHYIKQEELPTTCDNCGAQLGEVERI